MENLWLVGYYFFFMAAVTVTGGFFLQRIKPTFSSRLTFWIHAWAVGCVIQSSFFIVLGAINLLYPVLIFSGYFLPLAVYLGWLLIKPSYRKQQFSHLQSLGKAIHQLDVVMWLSLSIFLIPLLGFAFLYPISWDAVAYHLLLPKFYFAVHSLQFVSWFPQTAFPLGIHSLLAFGETFHEPRFGALLTLTFIGLIPVTLVYGLKANFPPKILLISALMSLCLPLLYSETGFAPGVDYPLALFALLALTQWAEFLTRPNRQTFHLALIYGGFVGLIKVSGLFIPLSMGIVLAVEVAWLAIHRNWEQLTTLRRNINGKGLVWLIPSFYWYLRTWIAAHNPIYPFLNNFFRGFDYDPQAVDLLSDDIQQLNNYARPVLRRYWHAQEKTLDMVSLADISLIAFVIGGAMVAIFSPQPRVRRLALLSLLSVIPILLLVGPLQRYYLALIPVLVLVTVSILFSIIDKVKTWPILSLPVYGVLGLILALQIDATLLRKQELFIVLPLRTWTNFFSPSVAKEHLLLQDNYLTTEYANTHLDPDRHQILQLFDNRLYYLTIPVEYLNPGPTSFFRFDGPTSAAEMAKALSDRGFTHLIVSTNWGIQSTIDGNRVKKLLESEFVAAQFSHRGVTLYELK